MLRFHVLPIFVALSVAAGGAAAQQADPDVGIAEDTPRVVRISFADRAVADALANRIDVWRIYADEGWLEALVTPEEARRLEAEGFELQLDEAKTRKLGDLGVRLKAQTTGVPGFPCYRTVEETYAAAEAIVADHPDLATWTDIGDSWEKTRDPQAGWDLFVLKLTQSAVPGPKPVFFADFAIHARELATAEIGTRFAERLADGYGVDPDITWLLDHHEVHLLLQANPDGRKRAEAGAFWRKNTDNDYCSNTDSRGADLNRNFEFEWGCCGGSSGSQCNSTFRGPVPASEPEIQALQDYVRSIFPDQRGPALTDPAPPDATGVAVDVHSFGEVVLWPWGFTFDETPNGDAFTTLGRKLAFFNGYEPVQIRDFARADGDSADFFYGELGVAGLAYEVGTEFFEDCSVFESNVLPDMLDSLFYAARVARTPFLTPAGPEALDATATPASVAEGELTTLRATVDDTRFNDSNGVEPTQAIAAAEAFVDVPPWDEGAVAIPMVAADGTFDEGAEVVEATLDTTGLADGRHMLFVRGVDTAGNEGVVTAAFLDVGQPEPPPPVGSCFFTEDFDGGPGDFAFVDDAEDPAYTSGTASGGGVSVAVGGVDDADITDMLGSWEITCELGSATDVAITLVASLTQAANYESNETSELRLTVNGSTDVLASFTGDGNGGSAQTTGLQTFTVNASLPAGESTIRLGCFNDQKTLADERTDCELDSVAVAEAAEPPPPPPEDSCLFDEGFDSGSGSFAFVDDAEDPAYTSGTASGGDVSVAVGGVDDADVTDMLGSWDATCGLGSATDVEITVVGSLTQAANYESNETSELRLTVNGSTDVLASFTGDGNGGVAQTTGLQTFTVNASLPAGESTIRLGCFNDQKTLSDERTDCLFERVAVAEATTAPPGECTVDDDFESGAAGWFNDPASTCSTGAYTLGTPTEVTNGGVRTQVGGASSGVNAIFTAANSSAGADDVDGGNCILGSPEFPVSSDSTLSVSYFHGQRDAGDDPEGDFFSLEVSTDGGSSFTPIASHGDATSNASWASAGTSIPAGSNVVLRVQCSDGSGSGDLVECGIDDLSICAD